MRLRTKYLVFVAVLHLLTLVLAYMVFKENKIFFIASEIIIIFSLVISWQLYKELISPLKTLMSGVEAIRARDFNVKFTKTGKFEMDQLISVYNAMIDELRIERTRQEEQHFFLQKLVHTSPTGIIILNHDDRIEQVNPSVCELLNIQETEVIKKPLEVISHPVFNQLNSLKPGESKTVSPMGSVIYKISRAQFIDRGFPRSFIMIEELTAAILAAEKNAYGKVIRMMAHEVNNTVGPVNSILQSATVKFSKYNEADVVKAIDVAVQRNNNLNLFMRNFADVVRLPFPAKQKTDIHLVLANVAALMRQYLEGSNIQIQEHYHKDAFFMQADEQQMEQAFINIIKNAAEAIDTDGMIRIDTDVFNKKIIIANTGKPISSEAADKLFSPFFSTKKDGQGIGLTLVKEILHNHAFRFNLQTDADGITRFSMQHNG